MTSGLRSLIDCGTKLWLDSIDPDLVGKARAGGATGATSNPIIISDLIRTGRFDAQLADHIARGLDDSAICWAMTDELVKDAQTVFHPVWKETRGDDGYVSFEIDPLLEDPESGPPHAARVARYVELGKKWSAGHENRMIKVPATPAGLGALEDLAAAGVTLNVTLIFTARQYEIAREAVWRGSQRRADLGRFKSVYSIFVSRVDVYTEEHCKDLGPGAQGQVGIVNVKQLWRENQAFWKDKGLPLAAGDHLRQHRHQEEGGPARQVRRGAGRKRHPDESSRHQRCRRDARQALRAQHRPASPRRRRP